MKKSVELPMRRLGRTNLQVTGLSLGCFMFTGEFKVPQSEAEAILDMAFNSGINFADTAEMYGFGESEELVSRALQRHADKTIYISSKVGWLDRTIVRNLGESAYRDEEALHRAIKHSLWLLRRDRLDIMMVHEPNWSQWGIDPKTGDAPVMNVLESLKKEGIIGAIGMGGWDCDNVADLIETGRFDCALVAGGYTMIGQKVRDRVIPAAKKNDVGLIMGGTMYQGWLAVNRRNEVEKARKSADFGKFRDCKTIKRLLAVYDLSDETGMSVTELAVRFVISDPDITTQIPGAQKVEHLRDNLTAAAKGPLSADLLERIRTINRLEAGADEAARWIEKPGTSMKGIMFIAKGKAMIQDEPAPACKPGHILCRTFFSGLTNGTERNVLMGGNYGGGWPNRCGYQNVGSVLEVGEGAKGFAIGDTVYSGNFHQHAAFFAADVSKPEDPNNLVIKIPAGIDKKHAALFGMASVAMHDVRRAHVKLGDRVLVVGAGTIGLFTAQCVRAAGAQVTICDLDDRRLKLAGQLGAQATVNTQDDDGWKQLSERHGPFDVIIEDSGAPVLDRIIGGQRLLKRRGKLVVIAGRSRVDYAFNAGQGLEVEILQAGHFERRDLEELLRLVAEGIIKVGPIIQDVVPINKAVEIYDRLRDNPASLMGTVFEWN